MTASFQFWITLLLILSVFCALVIPARVVIRRLQKKLSGGSSLVPLLLLFLAVLFLRLAANLYNGFSSEDVASVGKLFLWENTIDAAVHALQSFSMDESYTEYQQLGKEMIRVLTGNGTLTNIYSVYSSLLNIAAPICGGAVLLDILADIFPGIAVRCKFWRRKVWFSQLDAGALVLAEQILSTEKHGLLRRPMIIFTDAYVDNAKEDSSELYYTAREIGAVCLKQDLRSMPLTGLRDHRIILNDNSEIENLKLLAVLTGEKELKHLRHVQFYVFYDNDRFSAMEADISERLDTSCRTLYGEQIAQQQTRLIRRAAAKAGVSANDSSGQLKALAEAQLRQEGKQAATTLTAGEKRLLRWNMDPTSQEYQQLLSELTASLGHAPTASELSDGFLRKAEAKKCDSSVYLSESEIAKRRNQLEQEFLTQAESVYLPSITRIQLYRNLVSSLLSTQPLYRPLLSRAAGTAGLSAEPEPLKLMILGAGSLGLQAIRSASWYGQMYDRLQISLVSKENPETVCAALNRSCPELLKAAGDNDTLSLYADGGPEQYSISYFDFSYGQYDLTSISLENVVCKDLNTGAETGLLDADYYLIALGSDELNISIADELRRLLCVRRFGQKDNPERTISYLVSDPELNTVCRERDRSNSMLGAVMNAFGSLLDLYTPESIFGDQRNQLSRSANRGYRSLSSAEVYAESRQRIKNSYNYWSSAARAAHLHYRMFSAWRFLGKAAPGYWPEFEKDGTPDYARYLQAIQAESAFPGCDELDDFLTWLEHRRWNAYIRSIGFVHTPHGKDYHLRLHQCLVECLPGLPRQRKDRLDQIGSYKVYDAPCAVDCELAAQLLAAAEKSAEGKADAVQ